MRVRVRVRAMGCKARTETVTVTLAVAAQDAFNHRDAPHVILAYISSTSSAVSPMLGAC